MHNNENLRCHFLRPMVLQQFSGSKMVVFCCVVIINVLSCTLAAGGSGIHHLEVDCYTLQMLRCIALTAGKLPANSMQIACCLCRAKMAVKESKFEWSCFDPADGSFKKNWLKENIWIWTKVAGNIILHGLIEEKSTLIVVLDMQN